MFKICTVGCGNMSTTGHGPSYAKYKKDYPDTCLAACCDLDEKRAKEYAEKFGFEKVYTNYIEMIEAEKRLMLASAYPQFAGQKNRVQLKNIYTWDIKSEGEMAGKLIDVDNEIIINFHNTLFFNDINNFKEDDIKTVSLAGLAYNISKLEEYKFSIDKGDVYKHFLGEFLKDNPDKTEADFEKPVCQVSADSFRAFNPTEYTCEYSGVGQIKDIKYTTFFDINVLIMNVEFANSDNNKPFCCNVYVTESVLGDYMPTVGDGIITTMWLTGYFEPGE